MNFRKFVDHPVKVSMIFLALTLLGALSLRRLPVNLFPDIRTPRITISVATKDLTPEETERRLTMDLERQLGSIKGVSGITSFSRENAIVVHLDFHWGTDMEFAYLDVKKSAGSFETNPYINSMDVFRFDPNAAPLMTLSFVPTMTAADSATTGSAMGSPSLDLVRLTTLVENSLKPRFEMLKGVAWVELRGAVLREVNVGVREEVMTRHMITPDKIIEEIRRNNISAEGGVVIESGQRMVLKFHSRFRDVADISRCIIAMEGNHPVYLEDLGEISVIETKPSEYVFQDGVMTVSMDIFREPDSNAILTAREVRRQVAALNSRGDFGIKIAQDRSRDVEVAIGEVIKNAALGMILAMLILWIFVRNIPATIITSLAIPVSIIATFCLMDLQNLSLNLMTLGGLALSAGMLVDNGIVVMENIFRHRSDGMSPPDASVRGVSEVAMAITAATLTTIVVFVPLVYVHGVAGILFRDQALTVVYSLLISLLVALVLLPMMAARIAPARRFASGRSSRTYESFLRGSLKVRWLLVVLFLILIFMTVKYGRRIPVRFFPESVGGRLSVLLEMPSGTSLERMADTAGRIQQPVLDIRRRDPRLASLLDSWHILKMSGDADRFAESCHDHMNLLQSIRPDSPLIPLMQQLVLNTGDEKDREKRQKKILKEMEPLLSRESVILSITTLVGEASGGVQSAGDRIFGTHTARMDVFINPEVMREFTAQDLMKIIRLRAEAVPELKCTFESRDEFLQQILGRDRGDLAVEIHAEDLPDLHKSAALAADAFSRLPGFVNIRTNMVLGEEACIIVPDQDLMLRGSFNTEEITGQIQAYLKGERSEKIKLSQGEMDLVIRNPRTEKEGLDGLFNLEIVSSAGRKEKLSNLVAWRFERTVSEIMRIGQERTVLVMADLQGVRYQDAVFSATSALNSLEWRGARSTWNMSGEEVRRRESFDNLFFALIIATILVYMVIASILESIIHPFTIMLSVPLSFAGVVAAFIITGESLNIMGIIGVVMLTGIVVNNAIVLLDRVRQIREESSATPSEALVMAGSQRLRPILMTSLTTILALVPLALGLGEGAELRRPMAVAVIGGLTSSTLLTLWIMPGLYLCVEDILGVARRLAGRTVKNPVAGKDIAL